MVKNIKECNCNDLPTVSTNGGPKTFYHEADLNLLPLQVNQNKGSMETNTYFKEILSIPGSWITTETEKKRLRSLHCAMYIVLSLKSTHQVYIVMITQNMIMKRQPMTTVKQNKISTLTLFYKSRIIINNTSNYRKFQERTEHKKSRTFRMVLQFFFHFLRWK